MEFDPTGLRHLLAVAPFEPSQFDVFVRTDSGHIEHYWADADEGFVFGPERLGGAFTTDPKVIRSRDGDNVRLHLIGVSGFDIVDWSWPQPDRPGWLGPPAVETLPGISISEPQPVWTGRLEIFATGVEGDLRHWTLEAQGWSRPRRLSRHSAIRSAPAVIQRAPGVLDVFAIGGGLEHWTRRNDVWTHEVRPGERLVGTPAVASHGPQRLDVFALRSDGVPLHWGWNGARWFDAEERLDMTVGSGGSRIAAAGDLHLVNHGPDRLTLIARTTTGDLVAWMFQAPDHWSGPSDFSQSVGPFAAWSPANERIEVLSRNRDGNFFLDVFVNDPNLSMGEPVAGQWINEHLPLTPPEPPPVRITPRPPDPDLLLVRPRDFVLLGLRFAGFDVQAAGPGTPGGLSAGDSATLSVMFPPQHLAEEVSRDAGPDHPPGPDGFRVWGSALSGASRLVVELGRGEDVPLTVDGVLDALRRGRLRSGDGLLDDATALEIPYGLVISPHGADGAEVRCAHPADEAASPTMTVGLWQTRVAAGTAEAGAPADLILQPLAADSDDPFTVPLRGGARARILLEKPTARIDRLALSALGGTLSAHGSWFGFTWEHAAALGRDQRVRVTTEGVLFPFGHRAEFVEITERVFESTSEGAIARLRTTTTLRVTEPVRREPDEAALRAAFPFAEVEITRTVIEGLDDPNWGKKTFVTPEAAELTARREGLWREAREIYEKLYGDMGPSGATPPVEDLAAGFTPDADELLDPDAPTGPDEPEPLTRARAARQYLSLQSTADRIGEQLAALAFGGVVSLDVFFIPCKGSQPVTFPVRLAGRLGDVHIELPLVFVADIDWPGSLITSPFQSLRDSDIAERVAAAHRDVGGDDVDVGGARIDLVRADEPHPADVCEVRRLHLVGARHDGGFRPRLGAAPRPDEGDVPAKDRWAVQVDLPSVRTLLGTDPPPLALALTKAVLESEPDLTVPFQVPDGFAKLATEFSKNTARSGGIVAPDIVADAISREHGLVSAAGLLPDGAGQLDPKKILSEGATLLGFSLADLIDAAGVQTPPQILSVAQPGTAPKVTMTWSKVKLATDRGSFVTNPESTMDIMVELGTAQQQVTCTVENVALALPDRTNKLLQVSFGTIVFTQTGTAPPELAIRGIDVELFGVLELLQDLQKAVDLGDAGPHIEASSRGVSATYTLPVPDVTTGAFQLTNLVFRAGIDVPFDGRPVSIALAFASREKPFNVSVLMFGGGGYVDLLIDHTGLRRIEIALEFGASLAMNFVVAQGEVHGMGGIRLVKDADVFAWSAYLRFGGSVSVFGLVSVSVEVTVTLTYEAESKKLTGRATLVLEIDLTLYSDSVTIDTGEWELIGGSTTRQALAPVTPAVRTAAVPDEWRAYRAAFAEGSVP